MALPRAIRRGRPSAACGWIVLTALTSTAGFLPLVFATGGRRCQQGEYRPLVAVSPAPAGGHAQPPCFPSVPWSYLEMNYWKRRNGAKARLFPSRIGTVNSRQSQQSEITELWDRANNAAHH